MGLLLSYVRLFGILIIPTDKIGILTNRNGEGTCVLTPAIYFWCWYWKYNISIEPLLIEKGKFNPKFENRKK